MAVGVGGRVVAAGGGVLLHLRKNPGVGGGGAADHDGVAASLPHHALGVFRSIDIAITDDGNADALLDGGDDVPVSLAGIALHARARVNGNGFDADGLGELGDVNRYDGVFVPTCAELDGKRNFYRGADGAEDLVEQRHVAKEVGAPALHDFFGGAAEIDVHRVVAKVFDHAGGFSHDFRAGAKELRGDRMLVFLEIKIAQRFLRATGDAFGAGELRHQHPAAAQPANHATEKRVRNASHRREDRGGTDSQVANIVRRGNH